MAEYEKAKRISIPIEDNSHLFLITTEVNAYHNRILVHVLKLVQHSSEEST
ncbi:hypothetical protein BH18THE2_BH18THE2_27350 [soil metagenome]